MRLTFRAPPKDGPRWVPDPPNHAAAKIEIAKDRERYPKYLFGLTAACGAYEEVSALDLASGDALVDCEACEKALRG